MQVEKFPQGTLTGSIADPPTADGIRYSLKNQLNFTQLY
jgi:hypothetical protein